MVVVALVLASQAPVGCGPEDEGASSNTPSVTQPTKTEEPPEEPTVRVTSEAAHADPPNVAETVATEIDDASIRRSLAHLTGTSPAPLASGAVTIAERGSPAGRWATAEYMKESFEAAGIPARILRFTSDHGSGFNVEATLQGTEDDKHLWVTAHLDSVHNAGANDNASGLTSILLTAEALKRLDLKHTVHFVAYDLEEVGLVGSSVYMRSVVSPILAREGDKVIIGNLNSDIVGYEEGGFDAELVTCSRGGTLDDAVLRASGEIDSPIKLYKTCLPGRSDHRRFWDAGLPAVWMFERAEDSPYPWTHEPGDTMDKLNIAYLRSMIQLTAAATALLAVSETAS